MHLSSDGIWHLGGSKPVLNECIIFSGLEYLDIYITTGEYFLFCFSMSPCEILFRKCQPTSCSEGKRDLATLHHSLGREVPDDSALDQREE